MSYWLVESRPLSLESPSESNDDDESEDVSDEDVVSESRSDCSKEYDDDDFDNKSLEIDEEERSKISAQINPDEDEDGDDTEEDRSKISTQISPDKDEDDEDTEEEKETIPEKVDSEQEKHQEEPSVSRTSLRYSFDDDVYKGQAIAAGLDEGETSMTESAESRTMDIGHIFQKLDLERKLLEQELEMDERHRKLFYNKLRTITHKMESLRSLQSSQNGFAHTDTAIHQLEMEAYQVQRAMEEKLGLGEEVRLRQQGLQSRIHTIESEISSLIGRARKASREMLDSDVSPVLPARDAYRVLLGQESSEKGCASERASAQTVLSPAVDLHSGNPTLLSSVDGVAAGIPLGYNHLSLYHKSWTSERRRSSSSPGLSLLTAQDNAGSISFNSHSSGSPGMMSESSRSSMFSLANSTDDQSQQMGAKVEMVYSLLSILGSHDKDDMARTLFAMSQSLDSCLAMRQSGCLPLLLQLLHGNEKDPGLLGKTRGSKAARSLASAALHNIVHCHHDDKRGRREARTLRLLEQIRAHCDQQRGESDDESGGAAAAAASSSSNYLEMDHHPGAAIAALMKLSFDEDYRHAICTLGGLQAIAELLEMENKAATPLNDYSTTIRRYSCMALTNLTFGDGKNKALLCSMRGSLEALTDQLRSTNEDLIQAAASVLRNLSWRADLASKKALREIGAVTTLMKAAMTVKKETTLKSLLSALWNLSSHCSENKAEICAVEGALQFLVSLLTYKSTAKTLAIIENGGGILRNVSSQIATREDYRQILRKQDCLKILLFHLKSPSLTIVSNACGTLWNLSARCEEDQNALREMDAISMLHNLVHSRHKMISSGSSAALKNLLSSIPAGKSLTNNRSTGSPRPSLHVRKQRALEAELDHNLSETCDNVDSPRNSPTEIVHRSESEPRRFVYHLNGGGGPRYDEDTRKHLTRRQMMPRNYVENVNNYETDSAGRSGSQDSVGSTHSDISHDRARTRSMLARSSQLLNRRQGHSLDKKGHQMGASSSTFQPTHPANVTSGYKMHADQSTSSSIKSAHDIPTHMHQTFSVTPHQGWLTLPNSHPSPYMHDAAVSTDTDFPAQLQNQPLFTQSTPSNNSRSFHCHDVPSSKPQHSTLLERLAKSSSGLSSSCNLNYSITAANSSLYSITDYTGHQAVASTASEFTDQPVNYSLKYQHEAAGTGDSKPRSNRSMHMSCDQLTPASKTSPLRAPGNGDIKLPANKSMHMSCDQLTPATKAPLMRAGAHSESLRACMNSSMNDSAFLNNSFIQDKASGNKSDAILSDISSMNPAAQVLHKPVPNLVHNQFYNQHGYQTVAAQASLPHCSSPRMSCSSNSSFGTSDYHHSPNHPHSVLAQSLPSCTAATSSGSASQEAPFPTRAEQFHTLQAAHQNALHIYPTHQFAGCPEPEFDTNLDQSMDLGFTSSGASEDSPYKDCQEQPINYSVCVSERKSRQDTKAMSQASKILSQDAKATSHELKTSQDKQQLVDYRISGSKNIDVISSDNIQTHQIKGTFPLSRVTSFKPTNSYNRSNYTMDENTEDDGEASEDDAELEDTDHDVGAQDVEMSISRPEPHATALISGTGTSHEMNVCHEKNSLVGFTNQSSVRSLHCSEIEETDGRPDPSSFEEKVEEAALPSESSSEESLSSLEADTTGSPHLVDYRQKTAKSGSSNPIREPAAAEFQNPLTRELIKCLPITPKSSNIITKKPLSLDKVHNSPKSESFISFTAFNEEDKPISFATRNQDMPLKHTFPGFAEVQPLDFSSLTREQEIPHLTFSTFQKNFQPPLSNQNSHHNNRLVTPRAKTMPTLIEQTAESESILGKSEFVELSSEEDSNSDLEEEGASQNKSSLSQISSKEKDTMPSHNMQQQVLTPNLPEVKETRSGSQVVLNFDTHIFDEAEHIRQMSDRIRQLLAEQQTQDSSGSSVSDISEEDEARGVPATTGTPLPLPPGQRVGLNSADISTPKKKSGIPMKTNMGALKMPSSLPQTRATAIVNASPPVDTRKVSGTVCEQLNKSQLHSEESNMIRHYKYDNNFDSSSDNSDDNEDTKHHYLSSFSHDESNLPTLKHGSGIVESTEVYSLEKSSQNLSGKNFQKDSASASECPRNASTGLSRIPKAGKIPRSDVKANQGMMNLTVPARAKQRVSVKANQATNDFVRQLTSTGIQEGGVDQANEMGDLSYDDSLSKVHEAIEALARNSQARSCVGDKGRWEHESKTSTNMYNSKLGQLHNDKTTFLQEHQSVTDKSSIVVYEGQRVQFIVGDKPLCLSRTSSPSSLSSDALSRKHERSPELSEYDMRYSSSCASLSKDQDFDEIPSEQVLLEQCRDSALLKPRLPLDPDKARKLTRTMFLGQKGAGGVTANRLSKSASVEMISEYHSGSEPDQDSAQSSLSQEQSSFENLMTRSCSDTAELVLNLQVPPSSSWQTKCSTWHQHLLQCQMDGTDGSYQVTGPYLRIITLEETDRLLVENVNLIMSEIQTTKLSGSSVDEDLFIENETISLVSNGYTSDTNSEVSATWSVVSDKTTDLSSATVTGNQIQVPSSNRVNGPRVLKPIMNKGITKRASVEEDGVKFLRGRRKPLYPGRANNATAAVKGNVRAVTLPVVRGGAVPAGNKRTVQNTVVKSDSSQAISGLKKTPPKNLAVVQPPPKTAPPLGNKNPGQRNINQRSRSAGPATTPRKSGISSPVTANVNKAGAKGITVVQAAPSTNRTNTGKTVSRAGVACNKSNLQSSINTSTGNSKIPTGSTITPTHSRLPGANTNNKNNNNVAVNNIINKSGWKGTRSASSNTLSNVANEKKAGQNLSKIVNSPSAIPMINKKGTESGFPKRRSSGSLSSLTSAEPGKCGTAGNQGPSRAASSANADTNHQVQPSNTETNKCNVDPTSKSGIADSNRHTSPSNVDTSKRIKYGNRNTKIATPNNDPKRCSSPNNVDPNKTISPIISSDNGKGILSNKTDQSKVSSTVNTNRRVTAGSTDSGKNPSDSNKNTAPGNLDPGKRSSLGNTESTKRSPPGSADASKSSQAGNVDSSRHSPSGNSDLNKPTLPGNTDANKNTPTGIPGRRQATSKIATLWKRDSPPSKGSPRSSTSSTSSKLPVSSMTKTTPTYTTRSNIVPPPGFKKKAATLPNSSLASSKTRAAGHGISKSSTYEKISSELQGHDKKLINRSVDAVKKTLKSTKIIKQNNSSSESEESFGKRGKIFQLFSSDDSDDAMEITRSGVKTRINSSLDPSDSAENVFEEQSSVVHTDIQVTINSGSDSAGSLDQIGDIGGQIDSSTFRKKKRDPCISDFDLPNADETCRSSHSFTSSFGSTRSSRTSLSSYKNSLNVDSIFNEMNIISFLHREASDASLDKKNKHTEEKSGGKAKSLVAQGLKRLFSGRQKEKEKESKTKSTNRESSKTKHAKSNGKEKRSGRDKREYDFFRSNIKIEPSTTWTLDDKLEYDLDSDIMSSTKSIPLRIENYSVTPTVMTAISQSAVNTLYGDYDDGSCDGNTSAPEKHMTKTEMLLARRRKNTLQSSSCEDSCGDDSLVTTV